MHGWRASFCLAGLLRLHCEPDAWGEGPQASPLAGVAGANLFGELLRLAARDAERLPVRGLEVLGEHNDLAHVIADVRDLAVNGLSDGMGFAANGHRAREVGVRQRIDGVEEAVPPALP